jgi:hypothetical protein
MFGVFFQLGVDLNPDSWRSDVQTEAVEVEKIPFGEVETRQSRLAFHIFAEMVVLYVAR